MIIDDPLIGIIGGNGLMGKLMVNFFEKNGYRVIVSSRNGEISAERCAIESDVLIISVPIDKTVEVIHSVAGLVKKDGLIMDLTSVKREPLQAMLDRAVCSVLGTHPVFGPGVEVVDRQTFVLCPGRGDEWQNWFHRLLEKNNAKVKVCSAEEHDKMMSVIQGLMHFTSITISHVLKDLDIDIFDSLEFASPIYKLRLYMVGRILNQDPGLYANIEMENSTVKDVIEVYLKTSENLLEIIKKGDKTAFVEYFNEAADFMGDFKVDAENYSNKIINGL